MSEHISSLTRDLSKCRVHLGTVIFTFKYGKAP